MRRQIDLGVTDPQLRALVIRILSESGAPQHDPLREAAAIYAWVHAHLRFVDDPIDSYGDPKETISPAIDVLKFGGGDCDDFTVLISTLLQISGKLTHIVTVASDPRDPSQFTHVYPEVNIDGEWIPVDAARPGAQFGVAPLRVYRRKVWGETGMLEGLGRVAQQRFSLSGYAQLRPLRKLPIGDVTAQDVTSVITAAGQAAASDILATEAAPTNIYGTVNTGLPATATPLYSAGYPGISPYAGYSSTAMVTSPFGTMTGSGMLLLLGVGLLGAALLLRR